jgi:hypothetical protein
VFELAERGSAFNGDLLTTALCRNFGGKQDLLDNVLTTFHTNCFGNVDQLHRPPVTHLIQANLQDPAARHLMLLTKNSVALPILFGSGTLDERMTKVLVGSEFQDGKNELHLLPKSTKSNWPWLKVLPLFFSTTITSMKHFTTF